MRLEQGKARPSMLVCQDSCTWAPTRHLRVLGPWGQGRGTEQGREFTPRFHLDYWLLQEPI